MKSTTYTYLLLLTFAAVMIACNAETKQEAEVVQPAATIDPAKPMALMMRSLYAQSAEMRSWVEAGKPLDSTYFRFLEFHKLEPTDSTVLNDVFYEHNQDFRQAFEELLAAGGDEGKFNALLTECISCHEDFCPGPIKRIKKLAFPTAQNS
jgi:hypothetical protein